MSIKVVIGGLTIEVDSLDDVVELATQMEARRTLKEVRDEQRPVLAMPKILADTPHTNGVDIFKRLNGRDRRTMNGLCALMTQPKGIGLVNHVFAHRIGLNATKGLSSWSKHLNYLCKARSIPVSQVAYQTIEGGQHVWHAGDRIAEAIAAFTGMTVEQVLDVMTKPESK